MDVDNGQESPAGGDAPSESTSDREPASSHPKESTHPVPTDPSGDRARSEERSSTNEEISSTNREERARSADPNQSDPSDVSMDLDQVLHRIRLQRRTTDPNQSDVTLAEVIRRSGIADDQPDQSDENLLSNPVVRRRVTGLDISNESHHSSESDPDWHHLDTCSNSSFSDASDGMDEDDPSKELPKVLQKTKPQHKWFAVREIMQREINGGLLFRENYYGSLHVVQRLELMYKMDEHSGCVNAINFDQSGTHLISGSDDRSVCVWDWPRGRSISKFHTGHSSNVFQCKYLGRGLDRIVTCSRDGQVRLAVSSESSWETNQLATHSQPCHKLTTLPTSRNVFLTAGEDALVLLIDVRQPKANKLMYVKEKSQKVSLYSIHANPLTGQEICLAGEDYYIRIYDRRYISRDGQTRWKLSPANIRNSSVCYVTCSMFNYNGTQVIGSYNDDDIYLFEGWDNCEQMPSPSHHYEGHRNYQTVKGVNFFGPKSEFVISGSDCGNIYIWDRETEAIVQFMRGDEDGVINCLEPHPHIPILATSGLDSDVKIWIPSCEHEPLMKGLKKTLKMNQANREMKYDAGNQSRSELVLNLWSHFSNSGLSHLLLTHHTPSTLFFSNTSSASSSSDSDIQSDASDSPQS